MMLRRISDSRHRMRRSVQRASTRARRIHRLTTTATHARPVTTRPPRAFSSACAAPHTSISLRMVKPHACRARRRRARLSRVRARRRRAIATWASTRPVAPARAVWPAPSAPTARAAAWALSCTSATVGTTQHTPSRAASAPSATAARLRGPARRRRASLVQPSASCSPSSRCASSPFASCSPSLSAVRPSRPSSPTARVALQANVRRYRTTCSSCKCRGWGPR
mmetsp:Transcript_20677/g.52670  ORF Transcript_20677/g.52670 Transcript_20677/m.52670 type:complete len:224 (-) Transcript_20677:414-1085(-)